MSYIVISLNGSVMLMFTYGFCLGVWPMASLVIKKHFPLPWIRLWVHVQQCSH